MKLRLKGASEIVQVVNDQRKFLRTEKELKNLAILRCNEQDDKGFSIVVNE